MVVNRRQFLKLAGSTLLWTAAPSLPAFGKRNRGVTVNDIHSQLNETRVLGIEKVASVEELTGFVKRAVKEGSRFSVCGGRHAGGGQQFASSQVLVDTTSLNRVLGFDRKKGLLEVEAGIRWPELLLYLEENQRVTKRPWGITKKQTGTDSLTLGGTISANAHGQGLAFQPIVQDIESFVLLDCKGKLVKCSRSQNQELFSLVLGGYGLFGVVVSLVLRLIPRPKVRRVVERISIEDVIRCHQKALAAGCKYGDFQADIDEMSDGYLRQGVFSSYHPVDIETAVETRENKLMDNEWLDFVTLAHGDKRKAFDAYMNYCEKSSDLVNWSDVWQRSTYIEDYHHVVDKRINSKVHATEVLTEVYVPFDKLVQFIDSVRSDFLNAGTNLLYSTIRFIEKDETTFLPWAKQQSACIIFNLHTRHTSKEIKKAARALRKIISRALENGGTYYLTYHRYADKEQVLASYPNFDDFLEKKLFYDPGEFFYSDWFNAYKKMFHRV